MAAGSFDLDQRLGARVLLSDGSRMPVFGIGVWQMAEGSTTREAVTAAIDLGYRLIDTATLYANERSVGEAVRAAGVPREEPFLTTKLWNDDQGFDSALKAFARSRRALGVDYVDLYLIHWPVPGRWEESWRALVRIQKEGLARSIGVSNFTAAHLERLAQASPVAPVVDQVECHPFLPQSDLLAFCRKEKVQLEAYSPLARGRRLDHPTLVEIARAHDATPAQVALRWNLQRDVVVIPKSSRRGRIAENAGALDFSLSDKDVGRIDEISDGFRVAWDPNTLPQPDTVS
ncbi:MAG TPA: aldo/keto reductase [Thermoplasmata archaeon]|nr:aldo/keto reductase [Thermoplasmata archaeon]